VSHWKHRATRCAVEGCDRPRRKGWSTCGDIDHHALGRSLYGAGAIRPIPAALASEHERSRREAFRARILSDVSSDD
jgi:hypothetical protein